MTKSYDIDVEQIILGCLILESKYFSKIDEYNIDENYFFESLHQKIFLLLKKTLVEDKINDLKILRKEIIKICETYGLDKDYLTALLNSGSCIVYIDDYLKKLKSLYLRRELENFNKDIINDVYDNNKDINDILKKYSEKINDLIIQKNKKNYEIKKINRVCAERVLSIENVINNTSPITNVIKTDIFDFDKTFGGIMKKELTILSARSSAGKTTFALQIALNVAKQNKKVLFFSQEMSAESQSNKVISNLCNIDSLNIRDYNITEEDISNIKEKLSNSIDIPLYFNEALGIDHIFIRKIIDIFQMKYGKIDLVIVDHLQIMKSKQKNVSRVQELDDLSMECKNIALDYDCGFILLSQLSRNTENREDHRPQLSDLRDSGGIEQNADTVFMLYRESYYLERQLSGLDVNDSRYITLKNEYEIKKNILDIMAMKNRNGKVGSVRLFFEPKFSNISDLKGYQLAEAYKNF